MNRPQRYVAPVARVLRALKGVLLALLCLVFLPPSPMLAQVDGNIVVSADRLPTKLENTIEFLANWDTWKYHAGDNAAWANPAFDDSNWETVDTLLRPGRLPQGGWQGIGWFRLHLEVDQALWNQPLVMAYLQLGASEVYLDGQRIYAFGSVGTSQATEETDFTGDKHLKLETITFGQHTAHVIAVRYSNFAWSAYPANDFPMGFGMGILAGNISDHRAHLAALIRKDTGYQFFFVGAPLAFVLLHVLLFCFYPQAKENLYYAFFTISYMVLTFIVFALATATTLATALFLIWLFKIAVILASVSGMRVLYALFYPTLPKPFWIVITVGAIVAALAWRLPLPYIFLFPVVVFGESVRVIRVAIGHKKDGAWIIGAGGMVFMLATAYQMLGAIAYRLPRVVDYPFLYGALVALIAISVYLARHFAQINRNLEERSNELFQLNVELEDRVKQRTEFIRNIFGRYVSDDVVETLLASPAGLKVGGDTRKVTILVSDLRGFSSLSAELPPEKVVALLSMYLEAMTDVIMAYEGTIDEFLGDGILVIFGAPVWRADDAARAIACAVAMQLTMAEVNAQNRRNGLPEIAMGIGINTGDVVVGNIGSYKRAKYGIVGSEVNLAYRIESYTSGGQILISAATLQDAAPAVKVNRRMEVDPKGFTEPITIYEVGGIGGEYNLYTLRRSGEEL